MLALQAKANLREYISNHAADSVDSEYIEMLVYPQSEFEACGVVATSARDRAKDEG
jgi:hypothetical protein